MSAEVEAVEAYAWAELQLALPAEARDRLGARVVRRGGATLLLASGTRELAINRTIALGLAEPLNERELDAVIAEYASAGVARFILQWCPDAVPPQATEWLTQRGFVLLSRITKLYRLLRGDESPAILEPPLRIAEIGADAGDVFEAVVAPALGVPDGLGVGIRSTIGHSGWRYYLAYDGARPVAGAALYVRGTHGWLGLGATLPGDRRRGLQSALLARRIADARAAGCVWVTADTLVTSAPSQSRRNMERQGFVALYDRPNYVLDLPFAP